MYLGNYFNDSMRRWLGVHILSWNSVGESTQLELPLKSLTEEFKVNTISNYLSLLLSNPLPLARNFCAR